MRPPSPRNWTLSPSGTATDAPNVVAADVVPKVVPPNPCTCVRACAPAWPASSKMTKVAEVTEMTRGM
jgi:hypothetical protein